MRLLPIVLTAGLLLGTAQPAQAADELVPSSLTLTAPSKAFAGDKYALTVQLQSDPTPVGETVELQLRQEGEWASVDSQVTDAGGRASFTRTANLDQPRLSYRAVYAGSATYLASSSEPRTVEYSKRPVKLSLTGKTKAPLKKREVKLLARLSSGQEAMESRFVSLERKVENGWAKAGGGKTDSRGRLFLTAKTGVADRQVYRAVFQGGERYDEATGEVTLEVAPHGLAVTNASPNSFVDQMKVSLRYRVKTRDGKKVKGAQVQLESKLKGAKKFSRVAMGTTNKRGWVKYGVSPRKTGQWRIVVKSGSYYEGLVSKARVLTNKPPASPIRLSGPAPRIKLPAQPRAVLPGPAVRISAIPDGVWRSMQGKSWRPGCTARSNLRYVRANYIAFDGYARQGQLVVLASAAGKYKKALESLYHKRLPIRSMYLVDRFGYSSKLRGANDYKSMAADNTSAFNCRDVVGRPGVKSPHASGRAFDINPWENPYRASYGWTPNSYWVGKTHPRVAWRSSSHAVVKTLRAAGFSWTYGVADAHHFDA